MAIDRYETLLRQQSVLAKFGELALRCDDLDEILTEACRLVGEALGTDLAKVMELQDDGDILLVRAGVGWKPGVVGVATVTATSGSSEGHVLTTGEPTISSDIENETRFFYAPFLKENGVRAAVNVIIRGHSVPAFGVLQVDSRVTHVFTDDDTKFLGNYANLLAGAVDRYKSKAALAISHAALEARVIERTEELSRVNRALEAEAADRARLEEVLRQAMKMEAVGQLTGGIAHDFNNLLAGISGSLDLIEMRLAQGRTHELQRYISSAVSSVKRASALTHRLLAFSRRQTLDPKPTNIGELIVHMEELFVHTVGPHIKIRTEISSGLWSTLCDQNQIENVILNLVLNSRDSMPDGGTIIIHAANIALSDRETAKGWITDTASASRYGIDSGNYIVLSVSDTGTGMTPNVLTRAFDPFFTTKPLGQGTGLGLSMTFGFVKQSGGHINLESDVGQGTKVTIYLPQYREEATDDSLSLQREGGLAMAERPVILLVEDEPDLRMLLAEMLSDLNYTVLEADAGRSGLNLLETSKRIDLLVTDVGLPGGMNGRQLADAAREQRPELKVLFVTGFDATAGVAKTLLNDGMEVMTKPFAMSAFQTKIEGMMVEYLH